MLLTKAGSLSAKHSLSRGGANREKLFFLPKIAASADATMLAGPSTGYFLDTRQLGPRPLDSSSCKCKVQKAFPDSDRSRASTSRYLRDVGGGVGYDE